MSPKRTFRAPSKNTLGYTSEEPRTTALRRDYGMALEYTTYESRLASFAPPTKRSKAGWPHKTPKPADLARSGFFYTPSVSKDSTQCFFCDRHLDGWEAEDDPLAEHLKHGGTCAYAKIVSIELEDSFDVEEMEDPTSESVSELRRVMFETIGWPHEGKRGWTCKTEAMVAAGWSFMPTSECDDFTKCVYCKLSLDGWEPKDDPFQEHYRRSPGCPFFHFAGTTAPSKRPKKKAGRKSKASRGSKASRLSTQSNNTMLSQVESLADLEGTTDEPADEPIDATMEDSNMSLMSTASTVSKSTKGKRKAPSRAKGTNTKMSKIAKKEKEPVPEREELEERIETAQTNTVTEEADITPDPTYPSLPPDPKRVDSEPIHLPDDPDPDPEDEPIGPPPVDHTPTKDKISPIRPINSLPRPVLSSPVFPRERPAAPTPGQQRRTPSISPTPVPSSDAENHNLEHDIEEEEEEDNWERYAHTDDEDETQAPSRQHGQDDDPQIQPGEEQEEEAEDQYSDALIPMKPPQRHSSPPAQTTASKMASTPASLKRRSRISQPQAKTPQTSQRVPLKDLTPQQVPLSIPQFIPSIARIEDLLDHADSRDLVHELAAHAENGELTTEERDMTVQEWIKHLARDAEAKLRQEGERMVDLFETEGRRALEGVEAVECSS